MKDKRSSSTGCTVVAGGNVGGHFGVVPGTGPIEAGGALYFGIAFGDGSICNKSVTSAVWSPNCVDAAADVAAVAALAATCAGAGEPAMLP